MDRRQPTQRMVFTRLVLILVAIPAVLVALPSTAQARPTADPSAPTPSAPRAGRPPLGHAPDGRTVGGEKLGTRGVVAGDDRPALPEGISASGWLVADADSGEVLAARDPHGRYYPASTLKTLTLLTLAPLLDPAKVVTGTIEDENIEGSRVGLVAGGQYPVSLLFQALVLQSGNDAANALSRTAGGVPVTVAAMNETAEAIGAYDTVAGTPSGLDVAGQSSSAYDLALIFRALLADPTTAALLATPTADMPPVEGRSPGYQIQNQNPLLTSYPGSLGGKTGFTDAARHTFVTAAERDDRRLVVSVMDTENVPLRAADQAALLLDWGFSVPPATDAVGTLVTSGALGPRTSVVRPAPPAAAATPVVEDPQHWRPLAVVATALAVVVATLVGRRRAVRVVPAVRPVPGPAPEPPPGPATDWPSRRR